MEFQFQTMRQSVSVIYDGLKAYDPKDLSWQKIMGSVHTTDESEEDSTTEPEARTEESEESKDF